MPPSTGQRSAHPVRIVLALTLIAALLILTLTPASAAAAARCREGFELLPGAVECTPVTPQEPPVREEPGREPPPEPVVEIPPVAVDPGDEDPVVISDPEDSVWISDPEDSIAVPEDGGGATLTDPPASLAIDPVLPQDPSDELGKVSLYKRGCPAGFDAYAATLMALVSTCDDPMQGTTFTLYHGGGSSATLPTAGDVVGASYVEWPDVFPGPFTLAEDLPPGFGTPIVTCNSWVDDVEGPEILPDVSADGAIVADLPPGGQFHCYWFNVPLPESSASVVKWLCPPETDTTSTDQNDYFAACTTPMDDVVFHLLGEGQDPANAQIEATAGGIALFDHVQYETVTITEQAPAGYLEPIVFCATHPAPPADPPDDLVLQIVSGGQITVDLGPGHNLACSWFNVPEGDAITAFSLEKWLCPADIDTTSYDLDLYLPTCSAPHSGVNFSLTGDAYGISGTTVGGAIVWPPLVPGSYTVTEKIPAGFGEPIVFCGLMMPTPDPTDQAVMLEFFPWDVFDGNAISVQAHGEPAIYCHWFNVPLPDDGDNPDDGDDPTTTPDPSDDGDPTDGDDPTDEEEPTPNPEDPGIPATPMAPDGDDTPAVLRLPDTGAGTTPERVSRWLAYALVSLGIAVAAASALAQQRESGHRRRAR